MVQPRILLMALLLSSSVRAAGLPEDCSQLIVGLAPDWNAIHGRVYLLEKTGGKWTARKGPIAVLFGKNGLAWGTGLAGQDESGLRKKERDGRAPAGVFRIGEVFTYDDKLPAGSSYPFHTVTAADIWSDDPRSPNYNRHIVIDPKNPPDNYSHEKMRGGDFAYRWLVEVRHNSDPPVPGDGSAIFFHLRRGENRPTAGCTTMAEENLTDMISWLRKGKNPCYALLPESEYRTKWKAWNLPAPEIAGLH